MVWRDLFVSPPVFCAILGSVLNGDVSWTFIGYGRKIFADEKGVSGKIVGNSSSCNDNFISSAEVV